MVSANKFIRTQLQLIRYGFEIRSPLSTIYNWNDDPASWLGFVRAAGRNSRTDQSNDLGEIMYDGVILDQHTGVCRYSAKKPGGIPYDSNTVDLAPTHLKVVSEDFDKRGRFAARPDPQ